ncbi:MAG: hypothetical protein ACI8W8_002648 [Rhodothermales bacterium]|jgi:hypothetical protein
MVGPAGETLNRCCTNSLSQLAAQTAAAEGDEALGSAIFSLREKWVVGLAGETSNQLFEILQDWNTHLERSKPQFREPTP